jgi:sec-independent protein translocase protein TatB
MFDLFDPSKIFIVGIVALLVIGPKDLPRVMRTVGQVVGRMRRMAAEFQAQFNDAMREAELDDLRKELAAVKDAAKIDVSFNPAALTQHENAKALEAGTPPGEEKPAEKSSSPSEASSEPSEEASVPRIEAAPTAPALEQAKPETAAPEAEAGRATPVPEPADERAPPSGAALAASEPLALQTELAHSAGARIAEP